MKLLRFIAGTGLLAVWAAVVVADVWDLNDFHFSTVNELVHGTVQEHELGHFGTDVRDRDTYRIGERPHSSYEVVVDSATAPIAASGTMVLERYSNTLLVQGAQPYQLGPARSLRWENTAGTSVSTTFVRVSSTAPCFGLCSSSVATYRIRAYDTTYAIPRFNNAGSQITVLQIQNTGSPLTGHAHFLSASGALLGSHFFGLDARELLVLNTATLPFAAGQSGSILVSHSGHYGQLAGKAVALEPSTGFTFDTAMTPRPR